MVQIKGLLPLQPIYVYRLLKSRVEIGYLMWQYQEVRLKMIRLLDYHYIPTSGMREKLLCS